MSLSNPMNAAAAPARLHALLPCAGTGSRAAVALPKQYVSLAGQPVVAHTLAALARVPRLQTLLVLLSPGDDAFERHIRGWPGAPDCARVSVARCGGATRAETVRNGLAELGARGAQPDDWVLVHDAARCLVRAEWIDALIDACCDDAVGGLLALPVADTLKIERDGRVTTTLQREHKWLAQTPQMFRFGLLGDALARAPRGITDEAGAVEALGLAPKLVLGSIENLKLTYPADFELAERLLRSRR